MSTFRIKFLPEEKSIEANLAEVGEAHDGLNGSILHLADLNHIEIDHACGGVCACSTCHVIVHQGFEELEEASEEEEDMLDNAPGLTLNSRLACQAVIKEGSDLIVEIPTWNRNKVKEEH